MSDKGTLSFTPVDEIPGGYKNTKYRKLFQAFINSDAQFAVVNGAEGYSSGIACTLNRAANRFGFPVKAVVKNGKTYLVRLEPDAK